MPSPSTTVTCATHSKRPRVTSCTACGAAICKDCLVPTPVGVKCLRCAGVKSAAAAPGAQGSSVGRMVARVRGRRPPWVFPAAAAALVVVGLIAIGLAGGEKAQVEVVGGTAADDFPLDRSVQFVGAGNLAVAGTLTLPVGRQPAAGVLLVPGFGTVNRDDVMSGRTPGGPADRLAQEVNLAASGASDPMYKDLATALVGQNLAVLRYDKRGMGETRLREGATVTHADIVADANAGLAFLGQRVELEGRPLVVMGYDQGGVTAMSLAAQPAVKAVVVVSTPARNVVDVLSDHFLRTHGAQGPEVSAQLKAVAATLAAGQPLPARDSLSGHLRPVLPPDAGPYLAQVFAVEPLQEAAKVRVPTLVLRGADDPNVTGADAAALLARLPPGSEEKVAAAGDHNLADEGVRAPGFLVEIATWVAHHVGH